VTRIPENQKPVHLHRESDTTPINTKNRFTTHVDTSSSSNSYNGTEDYVGISLLDS
jgi:hypothetical protein